MKLCRMYLHHIQNSVFEGSITESNYNTFINELKSCINETEDSVLIYSFRKKEMFHKKILGIEKNPADNIL